MTRRDTPSITNASRWDAMSDHHLTVRLPARRADRVYVYILWGRARRPLYVGKARNPWTRLAAHMSDKPWADQILRSECYGFSTERAALNAEMEAIRELDPIHNVIRSDPPHVVALRMQQWKELQAKKRADRARAKAHQEERSKQWAARRAARAAAKKVAKPPRPPKPEATPKPPKQVKWRDDIFTPEQLAIIARVQNRERAA